MASSCLHSHCLLKSVTFGWLIWIVMWSGGCAGHPDEHPGDFRNENPRQDSIHRAIYDLQSRAANGFTPGIISDLEYLRDKSDSLDYGYGSIVSRLNLGFAEVELKNDYLSCMAILKEAHDIAVKKSDGHLEAILACNIALLDGLRGYVDGLPYAYSAYNYGLKNNDAYIRCAGAQTIAMLEVEQRNYKDALRYSHDAVGFIDNYEKNKIEIQTVHAVALAGIGRNREAEGWFNAAIRDSVRAFVDSKIYFQIMYGQYLLNENRVSEGISELRKGMELSDAAKSNSRRLQLLSNLGNAYEDLGNTDSAFYYQKQISVYLRNSHDASREREMLDMHNRLKEGEVSKELQHSKGTLIIQGIMLVSLIVIVLIISYACWKFFKRDGQKKQLISRLKERNDLTDARLNEALSEMELLRKEESRKYKGSSLTSEAERDLFCRLEKVMREESLFLDPSLNKEKLARVTLTNEAYLSQVVNNLGGATVTEYINRYRVEYAMKLLDADNSINLADLPGKSGFNSTTTFYRAFRTVTGMTPAQYLKTRK